jgi:phosphate transport system substrate-binding protein
VRARRATAAVLALVAVVAGLAGCDTAGVTLNGSGSSFQDTLEQSAIAAFDRQAGDITVNYTKSGSSAGKKDLAEGNVAFAGSDSPITPEEAPLFHGRKVLYFPLAAAPVTLSFDLPGIDRIDLTAEVVARIFQREIVRWDDPALRALNPGVHLPPRTIVPVVRSDGSGTTRNVTAYLDKAAPGVWKLGVGESLHWPRGVLAVEKNSGIAALVRSTPGAIGYVDLADAATAGLTRARLRNRAGRFVEAKLPGAGAALDAAAVAPDLTLDPLDTTGADAYPLTAPTWVLCDAEQPDVASRDALVRYLRFLLGGAQSLAPSVGFAPLPKHLRALALAQVDRIGVRGSAR